MGSELSVTDQERSTLSNQCAAAVKGNSMLGIIKKGIENKTANIIMPLCKMLRRLHFGCIWKIVYSSGGRISKKIEWNWKRCRRK